MWGRVTAAIGSLLLVPLTACSGSSSPTLVFQLDEHPDVRVRESFPSRQDQFAIQLDAFLCSTRPVRLTSVELYRPSAGIRLVRWGLANQPYGREPESLPRALSEYGRRSFASHVVTARCHRTDWYARVGLELRRTRPGPQSFRAVRITYDSAGTTKVGYLSEQVQVNDPRMAAPAEVSSQQP